ncbi:MAG: hypothetical protein J5779_00285 [Clostridia bacterium]|nr:hypothetical protein [Clostridia bacterium]
MKITEETLLAMRDKTNREHKSLLKKTKDMKVLQKIEYICNYFVDNYGYDYSVLNPQGCKKRKQLVKRVFYYKKNYDCTTVQTILNENVNEKKIELSPSLHLMKLGTCSSFSAEMEYFLAQFEIPYKKFNEVAICYDKDYPGAKNGKLRPMLHYFLAAKIDGQLYKIDIASAIMAKDFNQIEEHKTKINCAPIQKTNNPHKSAFDKLFQKQLETEKNT